jgi:hypothetical protein
MPSYMIENIVSGHVFGAYEAANVDALDVLARDAGYRDYADACDQDHSTRGDLVVTDVNVAALDWYDRADEPELIEFCDERGVSLMVGDKLRDDWVDVAMRCYSDSLTAIATGRG